MIISMSDKSIYGKMIAVTDRKLCRGDFEAQIRKVAALHPCGLILRERDLEEEEYVRLSARVQEICRGEEIPFFVHGRISAARRIRCRNLHLPLAVLKERGGKPEDIDFLSVSCHSQEDVRQAEMLGADRIILGTIFPTDCKPGLAGKGIPFVREICSGTALPVFAIGGISPANIGAVLEAGAAGGCMMSGFMKL